ncbi:MAG TPA: lipopolysaccharide kinase InaA family protein [Salinimicrobium sp.]|nr:lipopolysaccharide kinase InaA family protein [Salinimicrobium sp.]
MKIVISEPYKNSEAQILDFLNDFEKGGELFGNGTRNQIKLFKLNGKEINIKSFQIPNPVNKVAYRFFRKSKARRSFEYANILISKSIGTPFPIGFVEETKGISFLKSFYISEQLKSDLTYRNLVQEPDYPEHEEILRAFTRFTFQLHENNIEFLDHSPGNTLIQVNNGDYKFFLVDLNRMNFKKLTFEERMKNFSRLTPKKEMIEVMASEYAKCYKKKEKAVFNKMWFYTAKFQKKFHQKKELKKKLKFWE